MSNVSIFRSSNPAGQTERELGTQGEKTKFQPELPGADLELEAEIALYSDMCAAAQTPGEARMAWDWLRAAIAKRSAARVAEMQKADGFVMNAVPKLIGNYLHECSESDYKLIDETCDEFHRCRCYQPRRELLDAQDIICLKLDLLRGPAE